MLLASYEQFNGFSDAGGRAAQARSWKAHTNGIARLLLMRGPEAHCDEHGLQILRMSRTSQYAHHLSTRTACPFASEEWCTIPWAGRKKNERDTLYDVLLRIPGALEMVNELQSKPSQASSETAVGELLNIHSQLEGWFISTTSTLRAKMNLPKDKELDPESYMLHGSDIAQAASLYWSANMTVSSTLHILASSLPKTTPQAAQLSSLLKAPAWDPHPSMLAILKAVPYFTQPTSGLVSFMTITIPVGTALHYLAAFRDRGLDEPVEMNQLINLVFMASYTKPWGMLMFNFLLGMSENTPRHGGPRELSIEQSAGEEDVDGQYDKVRARAKGWYGVAAGVEPELVS